MIKRGFILFRKINMGEITSGIKTMKINAVENKRINGFNHILEKAK